MAVKPITPAEALSQKKENLPDFVLEAFNALIVRNLGVSGVSRVLQSEVLAEIRSRFFDTEGYMISDGEIFAKKWLDVEDVYRDANWIVKYDKPGYDDTFEAFFTFQRA